MQYYENITMHYTNQTLTLS